MGSEKVYKQSERITQEIDKRAVVFANDNLINPTAWEILFVKNAMLIGSSIALESEVMNEKLDREQMEKEH
jgi:hypothetical protein